MQDRLFHSRFTDNVIIAEKEGFTQIILELEHGSKKIGLIMNLHKIKTDRWKMQKNID